MSKAAESVKAFGNFLRECSAEIRKISWPNRQQLVGSVWVVGSLILLLSLYVFVCDTVLGRTMTWLVGLGR